MEQKSLDRLWTFESKPEPYFDVPSSEELAKIWQKYHGNRELLKLREPILGTCERPYEKPSVVVALDLCEVLRETALSFARLRGGDISAIAANTEGNDSDYGATFNGWADEQRAQYINTLVRHFMHHGQVLPVPYSEAIAAFIRRWRSAGAYVVADTSTMFGCEESTIRFLSEVYPKCFQGILLPRNHDGKGPVTKAMALGETIRALDLENDTPVLCIEDMPHHATTFIEAFDDVKVFTPEYTWNTAIEDSDRIERISQTLGTVDAFIAADNYLIERGIIS